MRSLLPLPPHPLRLRVTFLKSLIKLDKYRKFSINYFSGYDQQLPNNLGEEERTRPQIHTPPRGSQQKSPSRLKSHLSPAHSSCHHLAPIYRSLSLPTRATLIQPDLTITLHHRPPHGLRVTCLNNPLESDKYRKIHTRPFSGYDQQLPNNLGMSVHQSNADPAPLHHVVYGSIVLITL